MMVSCKQAGNIRVGTTDAGGRSDRQDHLLDGTAAALNICWLVEFTSQSAKIWTDVVITCWRLSRGGLLWMSVQPAMLHSESVGQHLVG